MNCWWIKRAAIVLKFLLKNGQKKSGRRVDLSTCLPYNLLPHKTKILTILQTKITLSLYVSSLFSIFAYR